MQQTFSIKAILKEARAVIKKDMWAIMFQYFLISFVLSLILNILFGRAAMIGTFFTLFVTTKWVLAWITKGSFTFEDISSGVTMRSVWYFVIGILLLGILIIIPAAIIGFICYGLSMFIAGWLGVFGHIGTIETLPAVIAITIGVVIAYMIILRLYFARYLLIEKHMKPVSALKESSRMTKGLRMNIFLFTCVVALINIAGFLCLVVGLLYTLPLTVLASGLLYKKFSAKTHTEETITA